MSLRLGSPLFFTVPNGLPSADGEDGARKAMGNLFCGMIFTTRVPTGEVASWLQAHCVGQWDLHPASVGQDGITRKFVVLFEREGDRSNFETRFSTVSAVSPSC